MYGIKNQTMQECDILLSFERSAAALVRKRSKEAWNCYCVGVADAEQVHEVRVAFFPVPIPVLKTLEWVRDDGYFNKCVFQKLSENSAFLPISDIDSFRNIP